MAHRELSQVEIPTSKVKQSTMYPVVAGQKVASYAIRPIDNTHGNIDRKLPRMDRDKMWDAVRLSNKDKSPGLDGLPAEFYEAFLAVLATPFHALANDVLKWH